VYPIDAAEVGAEHDECASAEYDGEDKKEGKSKPKIYWRSLAIMVPR
jgi:hypothetical protein